MQTTPMSVAIKVGRTKLLCPVASTNSASPSIVNPACTKTPNVRSTSTVPAASGSGVPLIAANRARTMSPPTAAEGTSVLTDSPTQRIQSSCRSAGRSDFGKRTHHASASRNTGTAKWKATTAAIAPPAEAKAAPTWGAPCRMSRIVKSAAPARPSNHTVIWIFPGAFIGCSRAIRVDARRCAYPSIETPESRAADQALSGSRLAQETLCRFFCRFHAHQNRFADKGRVRNQDHTSSHWLARNQAHYQPNNSEDYCREHIGQKMRAQGDTAESHQEDQRHSADDAEQPPVARFEGWQDEKQELPVKQRRCNRVATGKTVTRPIHERAINKRPMPMNKDLQPLVQQHAAGNSDDQCHERRSPFFPHKIQHHEEQDRSDPFTRAELSERSQHAHECAGQMRVEPSRDFVIGSSKGVHHGQGHAVLGENKGSSQSQ